MSGMKGESGRREGEEEEVECAWQEVHDEASRRPLFFNKSTGVTTFEKPDELKSIDERKRDIYLKTGIMLPDHITSSESSSAQDSFGMEDSSQDSSIQSSNVGFKMLQKMGWKEAGGLGKEGKGIIAPIEATQHAGQVGIGKDEEYNKILDEATRERKKLDVEIEQSEEVVQQRKDNAERSNQIEENVKNMHKEFFCEICNKQYINVHEMSVHLSSYDHHHKKRFKEMKESQKRRLDEADNGDRQRKEAKRAAKEVRDRMRAVQQEGNCDASVAHLSSTDQVGLVSDVANPTPLHVTSESDPSAPGPSSLNASAKPMKFGFSMMKKKKK